MRLRKPCEHGRWEAHSWIEGGGVPFDELRGVACPGGEFLPEDVLVIWTCLTHKAASWSGFVNERLICPVQVILQDQGGVVDDCEMVERILLPAFADQVGEPG